MKEFKVTAMVVNVQVREVWAHNLHQELDLISNMHTSCPLPYVFLDTEFPGFLRQTPRDAMEEARYNDLRFNVDRMKLVQLGITLTTDGENFYAWQFNLKDFDHETDACSEPSVAFLKKSGIDFDRNRREGVSSEELSKLLQAKLISVRRGETRWVTFHGLYDLAYLIKLVCEGPVPDSLSGFVRRVRELFGQVYDVKYMSRAISGCLVDLGLARLSKALMIEWTGCSHQAGHDSLLTALVFVKLKAYRGLDETMYVGVLYGIEEETTKSHYPMVYAEQKLSGSELYQYCDHEGNVWVFRVPCVQA